MRAAQLRSAGLLVALAAIVTLLPVAARAAATHNAKCSNDSSLDIPTVQQAIDAAHNGDTVTIEGACLFQGAARHNGDATSNTSAAVVVGAAHAIDGLTIRAAGSIATITGTGVEAAIAVAPDAKNVTIRNLRFVNVGRAVVAINTVGTTIGGFGGTPDPANGLVVAGGPLMDDAILGLAVDRNPASAPSGTVTLRYGIGGQKTVSFTGQSTATLDGFTVAGNDITFAPPGTDLDGTDVVGVAVAQRFERVAQNIVIRNNAVGMISPAYPTTNIKSIDVHSLTPQSNPLTGTTADYFIRNVSVAGNDLGRLLPVAVGGAEDLNAGGRTGIWLDGVGGFQVDHNSVRAVEFPSVIPMPGGGIVVSDSAFGEVGPANNVNVLATPLDENGDFGAIGVVDDVDTLFGGAVHPQPTRNITVDHNAIGTFTPSGLVNRGLVAANATLLTVRDNAVDNNLSAAIAIAPVLQGPGSVDNPGPIQLPAAVTSSNFCANTLDGVVDDPNQVSFGDGGGASKLNSFPGGALPDNGPCSGPSGPHLVFVPTDSTPPKVFEQGSTTDCVSFYLSEAPAADVTVTVSTDAQTTPKAPFPTFTPSDWNVYQWACASAVDDALVEGTHFSTVTLGFSTSDPVWSGAASVPVKYIVIDNDFGLVDVSPTLVNVGEGTNASGYAIKLNAAPASDVVVSIAADGQVGTNLTGMRFTPLNWSVPQNVVVYAVDDIVRETSPHFGVVVHRTGSGDPKFDAAAVPTLVAAITDNDDPDAPGITAPGGGSCRNTTSVTITGTAEPGATVNVFEGSTALGSATAAGGVWSLPVSLGAGTHFLSAQQTGTDGRVGRLSAGIAVTVDLTAPASPTITSPADGATVTGSPVTVTGTAEPGATVLILQSSIPIATAVAAGDGSFSVPVALPAGTAAIQAQQIDCAGNPSGASPAISFTVANPSAPIILSPANGGYVKGTFTISGLGQPLSTLTISEGLVVRATTPAFGSGAWSATITLPAGLHTLSVTDTVGATTSPAATVAFTVDTSPPSITIAIPPLDTLARVDLPTDATTSDGIASDDNGLASISVTYQDVFLGSSAAGAPACDSCPDPASAWSDATPLLPGVYRISARATDLAGNVSNLTTVLLVNA